MKKLFTPKLKV